MEEQGTVSGGGHCGDGERHGRRGTTEHCRGQGAAGKLDLSVLPQAHHMVGPAGHRLDLLPALHLAAAGAGSPHMDVPAPVHRQSTLGPAATKTMSFRSFTVHWP